MTRIVVINSAKSDSKDLSAFKKILKSLAPKLDYQSVEVANSDIGRNDKTLLRWASNFNQRQKDRHVERNILIAYDASAPFALQAAIDKPGLWDDIILVSVRPGVVTTGGDSSVNVQWLLPQKDFLEDKMIELKPRLHWFTGEQDIEALRELQNLREQGFIEDLMVISQSGHRILNDNPKELATKLVDRLHLCEARQGATLGDQ